MNIQIKKEEICFILPEKISYDLVTTLLKKQEAVMGIVFCRRQPGAQFLQWTVDGNGWERLANTAEPLYTTVLHSFEDRQKAVYAVFGGNNILAQAVLTTPSDEYVLYRQQANGTIDIALVAWGYKFPHKSFNKTIEDHQPLPVEEQRISLCFVYDGQREKDMPFQLDGKERKTGADGIFDLGSHPIGKEFTISYDNGSVYNLQVEKGRSVYEIDFTKTVTIEVIAYKDGEQYADASCTISYKDHHITLQTGANGHASVECPFDREGAQCVATIEGVSDSKQANLPKTVLYIELETPKPKEDPVVEEPVTAIEEPEPPVEPPIEEKKMVRIRLLGYKGAPLPELNFTVKTKGGVLQGKTDDNGYAVFLADLFMDGEKPKVDFTITKEYKRKHDIYAKPQKK